MSLVSVTSYYLEFGKAMVAKWLDAKRILECT